MEDVTPFFEKQVSISKWSEQRRNDYERPKKQLFPRSVWQIRPARAYSAD